MLTTEEQHDMNAPIALLIVLAGTVLYHLVIRTAPKGLEPFSLLTIVYVSAGLVSLGIAVKYEGFTLQSLSRNLHPSAFGIAVGIPGGVGSVLWARSSPISSTSTPRPRKTRSSAGSVKG